MIYFFLTSLFFIILLIYFKIADHYNIIDHPNERSSHTNVTIRGGGIVFVFAAIVALVWHHDDFCLPLLGVFLIGTISFLDDIYTLSNRIRIVFHILAVTLVFLFLEVFKLFPLWEMIGLYILSIGIINAYNFMDGINGLTGAYSLVILGALQWVNKRQLPFINPDLIWLPLIACGVFLYFNFRKKAKCFAGDVGSITIALWIIVLLFKLIFASQNWVYLLFLAVYGVDSILTIAHRLILKQNIFKAHRLHFYQLLANERRIPHLIIASSYALIQLTVILLITVNFKVSTGWLYAIALVPLVSIYVIIKPRLQKTIN